MTHTCLLPNHGLKYARDSTIHNKNAKIPTQ